VSIGQFYLCLADGNHRPVGTCWSIRAKKNDFYIEPVGSGKGQLLHLSLHGPRQGKPGTRFHLKVNDDATEKQRNAGQLVEHGIPASGQILNGVQVADRAFLVCRLRWMPSLQNPDFSSHASVGSVLPDLREGKQGLILNTRLEPDNAWDLDLVVSHDAPYWPHHDRTKEDGAQLVLESETGMYLIVTSFHRNVAAYPAPDHLTPSPPTDQETPQLLLGGGLDSRPEGEQDMYWLVETITSRELLQRSFPNRFPAAPQVLG